MREERVRAYGEQPTRGIVLARLHATAPDAAPRLRVAYRDQYGLPRETVIPVRQDVWESAFPGKALNGRLAVASPALCRFEGQQEEPFRLRLRAVLGIDTP